MLSTDNNEQADVLLSIDGLITTAYQHDCANSPLIDHSAALPCAQQWHVITDEKSALYSSVKPEDLAFKYTRKIIMLLRQKSSGHMVEVANYMNLIDLNMDEVEGRIQEGEEVQDPDRFNKLDLVFLSGEDLPRCWSDPHYRTINPATI